MILCYILSMDIRERIQFQFFREKLQISIRKIFFICQLLIRKMRTVELISNEERYVAMQVRLSEHYRAFMMKSIVNSRFSHIFG